jgi:WD40 repeat protein
MNVYVDSSDNFKVGCDWSRAVFSPTAQLVCAGGADGGVFVWSATSGRLVCEGNHREHG